MSDALRSQSNGIPLEHGLIGTKTKRYGGLERAMGAQKYVADLDFPDALQVAIVTIPVGCADILGVDTTAAEAMPGVVKVLTAADLPSPMPRFGVSHKDRPVMADRRVNFFGEPVAAVAAETKEQAEAAARAVRVAYRELPGAYTLDDALAPGGHIVQDPSDPTVRPKDPLRETNVLEGQTIAWGDIAEQEALAALVVEDSYTYPMMTQFPIEPLGFVVEPTDAGGIDIYCPVQHPFLLQRIVADLVGLPLTRVRVVAPDPGGGFGGKQIPKLEPLVAFLALQTGRTCRMMLNLAETTMSIRRAGSQVRARTGFSAEGDILFHQVQIDYQLGAYADVAPRVMTKGSYVGAGPYRIPAVLIEARAVLTNTTVSTAMRGYGCPQISWATESQITDGAKRLGLDPARVRLRNLVENGETFVKGDYPAQADGEWKEAVEKAMKLARWDDPLPENHGRGIAMAIKSSATSGLSQSLVRLLFDGGALVYAGTSDMGQGARTIWAQTVADELGVPLDQVVVVSGDTDIVPFDLQTSASRSTVFMGTAVVRACRDVRRQVREMYAERAGVPVDEFRDEPGVLVTPDGVIPLAAAARTALGPLRGEFLGQGTCRLEGRKGHPLGGDASFYEFNCSITEVEVDPGTGQFVLTRHVTVCDVGTELNPIQVTAQDEGGAIMGIGQAIMEQLVYDTHGRLLNAGAVDYRVPTFEDVPLELLTGSVENHDGPGPYGSKGMSEGPILCTGAAVGAAVAAASGAKIKDLPLTPERVWKEIRSAAQGLTV